MRSLALIEGGNIHSADQTKGTVMDWRKNIIQVDEEIQALIGRAKRIAVLGIKIEQESSKPAFYVPAYLARAGFEIVPVPVYYPEVDEILGRRVYRRLVDIPSEIDIVDVFRRSCDLPAHVEDILSKRPKTVWFQSGIRNDKVAEDLARQGIVVVQDRCLKVEHERFLAYTRAAGTHSNG